VLVGLLSEHQEFQRMQAEDARSTGARRNLDVEVVFAENNAVLQIQQLYRGIHRPPEERAAAIVVETVVGEGLERVARAAVKAGVGWILVNRRVGYIADLRRQRPDLPICGVGTDQEAVGRLQARQVLALVPGGRGLVLYVQGPSDTSAAAERLAGLTAGLSGTGVEVRLLVGDWTEESGRRAVERWLSLKTSEGLRPEVIACQNDSMAAGARQAIIAAARRELAGVRLTGCDGLVEGGRRLVDQGVLAATVVTPSNTGPALELVARSLAHGDHPDMELLLQPTSYPELGEGKLGRPARQNP
jgi:ABC-type sugar transport system substrate-binding protein